MKEILEKTGKIFLIVPVILASLILIGQSVPQLINYQGRLTDSSGQPMDGDTVDLTFSFYGVESGGTAYLSVLQEDVLVTKGIYHVLIGSGTITSGEESTLADVFQKHKDVWMGLKVDTDPEMTPRSRITSSPYSLTVDTNWLKNLDLDEDGHYKPVSSNSPNDDCNDNNAFIYGGSPELCDGIDNQCPGDAGYGYVDEGCPLGPQWPTPAGGYDTPGSAFEVFVKDIYAYVGDAGSGLQIIDVSGVVAGDTTIATLTGNYPTTHPAYGVHVIGDHAYLANETGGLKIINVSNPSSPTLAGNYAGSDHAFDVKVKDNYAYMTERYAGLTIIEISIQGANTVETSLAGSYDTPNYARSVHVKGDYAYVADVSSLQIINISDPGSPSFAGSIGTSDEALDVYVSGNYAYVADKNAGLWIVNISNPSSPTFAGQYDTPGEAWGVYVSGNYAYVADHSAGGLQIINVSDPSSPTLAGSYDTPGSSLGVYVSGNYAYVADYDYGLQIIKVMNPP